MSVRKDRIVVAIGGNAILKRGENDTYEEQITNIRTTVGAIGRLILSKKYEVVLTHGNGPQVGAILLQNEAGEVKYKVPKMPMDVCSAESQGFIGYMIQQQLRNELVKKGRNISVVTIITQTVVSRRDPAFKNPTKPVGPFYSKEEAERFSKREGWAIVNDAGRGWRRVVPSPDPRYVVEGDTVKKLLELGVVPIVCGGGGIPVIKKGGNLVGVEAVIDKDLGSKKLAEAIDADVLMMVTDVDKVAIHYGRKDEKWLDELTVREARHHLNRGEFPPGNMGPKVLAAIRFVKWGGRCAIITSLKNIISALDGRAGTRFVK